MKRLDALWIVVLCGITAILLFPVSRTVFLQLTASHPYLMGFAKFAVMATMGELAALRIVTGGWKRLPGLPYKILIWGFIGMLIVVMFQVYTKGITGAVESGYLAIGTGQISTILTAFLISLTLNLTFGPMFMAAHRISDTYIDARMNGLNLNLSGVINKIDWIGFIRFVIGRTIPLFWIPAHTITFLLPGEFRVLYAAYLSIALGAILAYARRRGANPVMKSENPIKGNKFV